MRRPAVRTIALAAVALVPSLAADAPTFHKDVLPILRTHCQQCHRPGEIGPMPLVTYKDARPWAKAIRESVLSRKMPPWHADAAVGKFANDNSLNVAQTNLIARWVDAGAPEGDSADAPPAPPKRPEGWNIGTPDRVLAPPRPYEVPASGTVEYLYLIVPTGFTADRWVQALEVRPGNRAVVHHAAIHLRPPSSNWLRSYPAGKYFVPREQAAGKPASGGGLPSSAGATMLDERLAGYVPGKSVDSFPVGQARLIPAGSDLVFILHYNPNGKATTDLTHLGLVFSKSPPSERVYKAAAVNSGIVIPPGAPAHREEASRTVYSPCRLLSMRPHMHLRGKSIEFRAVYPSGEREILLRLPRYDFNWQLEYILDKPRLLPPGTRLEVTGVYDNSPNNRSNPDPTVEVRWGDQSWEEMLAGFFELAFDARLDLGALFTPQATAGTGK